MTEIEEMIHGQLGPGRVDVGAITLLKIAVVNFALDVEWNPKLCRCQLCPRLVVGSEGKDSGDIELIQNGDGLGERTAVRGVQLDDVKDIACPPRGGAGTLQALDGAEFTDLIDQCRDSIAATGSKASGSKVWPVVQVRQGLIDPQLERR